MTYPDDESYEFFLQDELFDADERLRDDSEFLGLLHDLFDYDLASTFDEGADAIWQDLHDYLEDRYDLELDDYFDWDEWRDEYSAA